MKVKKTIAPRKLKNFILAVGWVTTHRRQEGVQKGILEHIKIQEASYHTAYVKFKDKFLKQEHREEGNFHVRQK